MPIHDHFWVVFGIMTSKARQTSLVFGVQSGFISRSVHLRLQVFVCSSYNLCHHGWHPDTKTDSIWSAYMKSSGSWANKAYAISTTT